MKDMNTAEHLKRIVAKCRANLALAEMPRGDENNLRRLAAKYNALADAITGTKPSNEVQTDLRAFADYIAACAGAGAAAGTAEAGWKATIGVIEDIQEMHYHPNPTPEGKGCRACAIINAILAAWPEELL